MKTQPLSKILIPAVALTIGLVTGLGVGHIQIKKEQEVFQTKIREAQKKLAFVQKKAAEEKKEATDSQEQVLRGDLEMLRIEKEALGGEVNVLRGQVRKLDLKVRESDEALARKRKELEEASAASVAARKELREMERTNKDLANELKKTTGEKLALQAETKRINQALDTSESNNAELCVIAEELLKKYRNKGLGAVFMDKEPLTQIRKVELEQLIQKYQERIEQQKSKNNHVSRNVAD